MAVRATTQPEQTSASCLQKIHCFSWVSEDHSNKTAVQFNHVALKMSILHVLHSFFHAILTGFTIYKVGKCWIKAKIKPYTDLLMMYHLLDFSGMQLLSHLLCNKKIQNNNHRNFLVLFVCMCSPWLHWLPPMVLNTLVRCIFYV